jgi:hypothetical protein
MLYEKEDPAMILGILADTHRDKANAIAHVVEEFRKRGVEVIIHCGDIEAGFLKADVFGNLPVICALIEEQVGIKEFCFPPHGWRLICTGFPCGYESNIPRPALSSLARPIMHFLKKASKFASSIPAM